MFSNIIVIVFDILFHQDINRHIIDRLNFLLKDRMPKKCLDTMISLYLRSLGDQMRDQAVFQITDIRFYHIVAKKLERIVRPFAT